jgi:hypothetical protein
MNWHYIIWKLFPIALGCAVICISFSLPGYLIKRERKNKSSAPSLIEKGWAFVRTVGVCALISGAIFFRDGKDDINLFMVWFILSAIPAMAGLMVFFGNDSSLTEEQRKISDMKIIRDEKDSERFNSEY